jgi:hypothetical protein
MKSARLVESGLCIKYFSKKLQKLNRRQNKSINTLSLPNRAILDIYGYSNHEELKRTPIKERCTPENYDEFKKRKEPRDRGEFGPSEYEISIVRKNGEVLDSK